MTIGATVTVKNAFAWDYCLDQCLDSLLPLCDQINVIDSDSSDRTVEFIKTKAILHPAITLLNYPWPNVPGDIDCILRKMNWGRERLSTDFHIHLEADEVLGQESYDYIRNAATIPGKVLGMKRLNFWLNPQTVLCPGVILSPMVIRFAPKDYYLGGDAPHPLATQTEPAADWNAVNYCTIYHYGFLRRSDAYAAKYRDLMININGSDRADGTTMDLLDRCAIEKSNWMAQLPNIPHEPFIGVHPPAMIPWLKERGFEP
jgi:hypothetical protein